jgi:hypothetical protein
MRDPVMAWVLVIGIIIGMAFGWLISRIDGPDPIEKVREDKLLIERCIEAGGEPYTPQNNVWSCRAYVSEVQ